MPGGEKPLTASETVLHEISQLLNTQLDKETVRSHLIVRRRLISSVAQLTTCVRMIESGVNPEALAVSFGACLSIAPLLIPTLSGYYPGTSARERYIGSTGSEHDQCGHEYPLRDTREVVPCGAIHSMNGASWFTRSISWSRCCWEMTSS